MDKVTEVCWNLLELPSCNRVRMEGEPAETLFDVGPLREEMREVIGTAISPESSGKLWMATDVEQIYGKRRSVRLVSWW